MVDLEFPRKTLQLLPAHMLEELDSYSSGAKHSMLAYGPDFHEAFCMPQLAFCVLAAILTDVQAGSKHWSQKVQPRHQLQQYCYRH